MEEHKPASLYDLTNEQPRQCQLMEAVNFPNLSDKPEDLRLLTLSVFHVRGVAGSNTNEVWYILSGQNAWPSTISYGILITGLFWRIVILR